MRIRVGVRVTSRLATLSLTRFNAAFRPMRPISSSISERCVSGAMLPLGVAYLSMESYRTRKPG